MGVYALGAVKISTHQIRHFTIASNNGTMGALAVITGKEQRARGGAAADGGRPWPTATLTRLTSVPTCQASVNPAGVMGERRSLVYGREVSPSNVQHRGRISTS